MSMFAAWHFQVAMFHVRNELALIKNNKVKLAENSQSLLAKTLIEGFETIV